MNLKVKYYPHFDAPISQNEIQQLVKNPDRVAKNAFFPFISYEKTWKSFGALEPKAPRSICYAARRDAYIYSYYRHVLSEKYESELKKMGIADCPLAYRKIKKENSDVGKSNIDFAKDAFDEVARQGNCISIALDISSYFDSLDHDQIKKIWSRLLDADLLPDDHFSVYKGITGYTTVNRDELYERLGYSKRTLKNGREIYRYRRNPRDIPTKLCSRDEFLEKVCGKGDGYSNLISEVNQGFGIPQGSPISDVIANFYLIDFDKEMSLLAAELGGKYMRYSDDILVIVPKKEVGEVQTLENEIISRIGRYGSELKIKREKTSIVEYFGRAGFQGFKHIKGRQGKNGLEYLGFRFDGRKIFIRDKTLSAFYRKVSYAVDSYVSQYVKENQGKSASELIDQFNYSEFHRKFLRTKKDEFSESDFKTWSFWTYVKRAERAFGSQGKPIISQVSGFKGTIRKKTEQKILSKCMLRIVSSECN